MPEFEETQPRKDPSHNYSPSENTDKPRTRRRSGGFKQAPSTGPTPAKIGEVDPSEVLKESQPQAEPEPTRDEPTAEKAPEPREAPAAEERDDAPEKPDLEAAAAGSPEPSSETLAAIARVEERIAERRKERDARRKARGDKPGDRGGRGRGSRPERKPAGSRPRAAETEAEAKPGLIGAVGAFVGKLFGGGKAEEAPAPKPSGRGGNRGPRGQGGGGRPRGNGRRRGSGGQAGKRRGGGQGRGGQGRDNTARD